MTRPPIPTSAPKVTRHRATVEISEAAGEKIARAILGEDTASRITGGKLYIETLRPRGDEAPNAGVFAEDEARMSALGRISTVTVNTTRRSQVAAAPDEEGDAA